MTLIIDIQIKEKLGAVIMIHESANKEGGKKKICIKMIKLYLKKLNNIKQANIYTFEVGTRWGKQTLTTSSLLRVKKPCVTKQGKTSQAGQWIFVISNGRYSYYYYVITVITKAKVICHSSYIIKVVSKWRVYNFIWILLIQWQFATILSSENFL